MAEPFTHLHVSSAFSARHGVSWPDELAAAAHADGASALACTDHDGLYGAIKHLGACRAHGLDPIVGVDLAVLAEPTETDDGGAHPGAHKPRRGAAGVAGRVVVLAHGNNRGAGWRALCRLISDAHEHTTGRANGPIPVGVLRSELAARCLDPESGKPVLTVLLGPDSDVGRAMSGRRFLRPRTLFRDWIDAMPVGVLAAELVTHLTPPGEPLSTAHAVRMLRLASEHHVPAVLTNAARMVEERGAATAEVLAPRFGAPGEERAELPGPPLTGHAWLKPAALMRLAAREIVEAAGLGAKDLANLLGNTERIADRCRLDPAEDAGWGRPVAPEAAAIGVAGEPLRELAERCRAGITRRFPGAAGELAGAVELRLEHELEIIGGRGFASYFLTVAEVADLIRGLGVRSAVRGMGASSLVNYLLGVSHVDPLRHDLVFEDYLPRERSTFPDITLDVESAQLHHVYRKIFERFGAERVTLMGIENAYGARGGAGQFHEALAESRELRELEESTSHQLELLGDPTERLDRLPRTISMQPCGVILGDARLLDRTPVRPSGMGLPTSQFDKHDMEPMGMLGLGVVGVRMQSSMAFAVREIERVEGTTIDLDALPFDDEPASALPTCQSSWLEARHPEAFLAGIFEHDPGTCTKRLLVAEARRLGVPILPVDINASRDEYRIERIESGPDAGRLGIRPTLKGIHGLSANELKRIVAGQPYSSITELRDRARLTRASVRRLAELGAFGSLHREAASRGSSADLVAQLAELAPRAAHRGDAIEGQLPLEIGPVEPANLPAGLPEPSSAA